MNLATAFLAASVVALLEDLIARLPVLAVLVPVVAGRSGAAIPLINHEKLGFALLLQRYLV